jgi:hypothetical protein
MQRGLVEFAVLDKGLRSPNPGKQCEAILQFVPLLQRGSQVRRGVRAGVRDTREAGRGTREVGRRGRWLRLRLSPQRAWAHVR